MTDDFKGQTFINFPRIENLINNCMGNGNKCNPIADTIELHPFHINQLESK